MELEHVLARLADAAKAAVGADAGTVRLFDPGPDGPYPGESPLAPLDAELAAGTSVIVADVRLDPRLPDVPGDHLSLLAVPLCAEGRVIGALYTCAGRVGYFDVEHVARLTPLAELGAAAIAAVRSLASLQDVQSEKIRFIHVATHELRSPIVVAQSLVRSVAAGYAGPLSDQQAEIIRRISRRLDVLENLVNDLLDLAASQAHALAESETDVSLRASIGRAILLLQPRAEEKGVTLTYRSPADEFIVRGAEDGMDRIFVNLVGNAVKYTPTGGRVTVVPRRLGDRIEVEIADTGIGIPEEALPRLFTEFYRAPNARAISEVGTGLGLVIVKDLVEQYGGRITVESKVGEGSTFRVTFPAATAQPETLTRTSRNQ